MTRFELDQALKDAHARRDAQLIAELFGKAGDREAACGNDDAACFFWTNGYVWALEAGAEMAGPLHQKLCEKGRDA